jgi:hypothetical protein
MRKTGRRNKKILGLYRNGKTLEEIGKKFRFTRSRAQQVVVNELKKDILDRLGLKKDRLSDEELVLLDVATKEEIKEISNRRKEMEKKEIRERLENKIKNNPYANFLTVGDYAKSIDEKPNIISEYFPEVAKEIVQKKKKKWSWHYNKCRICGTTSIKHQSHGLCEKCYPKSDIFKDMQEASRQRNIHKWRKKQREYQKQYSQRPEVKERLRKQHDLIKFGGNREKILERDGFKCIKCGMSREESKRELGRDLYVPKLDKNKGSNIDNFITLCQKCHTARVVKLLHKNNK